MLEYFFIGDSLIFSQVGVVTFVGISLDLQPEFREEVREGANSFACICLVFFAVGCNALFYMLRAKVI